MNDKPNARWMVLRGVTQEGFIFFTNVNSKKMEEIKINPNAVMSIFLRNKKSNLAYDIRISGKLSLFKPKPEHHHVKINNKTKSFDWHALILKPTFVKFSQLHLSSELATFENLSYSKNDSQWIVTKEKDYIAARKNFLYKSFKLWCQGSDCQTLDVTGRFHKQLNPQSEHKPGPN